MFQTLPFSGAVRVGVLLGCGLLGSETLQGEDGAQTPTQIDFAIKLARALGHDVDGNGSSAIEMLSSLSIIPGLGPDAKWKPEAPATTKFVADIQASLQLLLKRTAEDLAIAPPPTLDLFVFELPPGPQKVFFPAEDQSVQPASFNAPADPGEGTPIKGTPETLGPHTVPQSPGVADPVPGTTGVPAAAATPHPPPKPSLQGRTPE